MLHSAQDLLNVLSSLDALIEAAVGWILWFELQLSLAFINSLLHGPSLHPYTLMPEFSSRIHRKIQGCFILENGLLHEKECKRSA